MAEFVSDNHSMRILLEGRTSVWLPLLSGSMAPFLLPGDKLFIEPKPEYYKIGDIAVFISEGTFFSHRVLFSLRFGKKHFLFEKGDSNRLGRVISYNKAIGIVTKIDRKRDIFNLNDNNEKKRARKVAFISLVKFLKHRLGL